MQGSALVPKPKNVATEMSLSVLAYNFKRVLSILGFQRTYKAMQLLGA